MTTKATDQAGQILKERGITEDVVRDIVLSDIWKDSAEMYGRLQVLDYLAHVPQRNYMDSGDKIHLIIHCLNLIPEMGLIDELLEPPQYLQNSGRLQANLLVFLSKTYSRVARCDKYKNSVHKLRVTYSIEDQPSAGVVD